MMAMIVTGTDAGHATSMVTDVVIEEIDEKAVDRIENRPESLPGDKEAEEDKGTVVDELHVA